MEKYRNAPDHVKYGLIVGLSIWFVGWVTGLGGSFLPNIVFSIVIGLFAAALYKFVVKRRNKDP
jgi:hypothetical protein